MELSVIFKKSEIFVCIILKLKINLKIGAFYIGIL